MPGIPPSTQGQNQAASLTDATAAFMLLLHEHLKFDQEPSRISLLGRRAARGRIPVRASRRGRRWRPSPPAPRRRTPPRPSSRWRPPALTSARSPPSPRRDLPDWSAITLPTGTPLRDRRLARGPCRPLPSAQSSASTRMDCSRSAWNRRISSFSASAPGWARSDIICRCGTRSSIPSALAGNPRRAASISHRKCSSCPTPSCMRLGVPRNPVSPGVHRDVSPGENLPAESAASHGGGLYFDPALNAMIAVCTDENPKVLGEGGSLAQQGFDLAVKAAPAAATWIGVGCDFADARCGLPSTGSDLLHQRADSRRGGFLLRRLCRGQAGPRTAHRGIVEERSSGVPRTDRGLWKPRRRRPRIDVGNPVLNSAFGQYPEAIHFFQDARSPGAVRASMDSYFVWGWDGRRPGSLPFGQRARVCGGHSSLLPGEFGTRTSACPTSFSHTFQATMKEPFPAQGQT